MISGMKTKRSRRARSQLTGMLYVLPFALVWLAFLVWPVIYGFYISLWKWDPLRGSEFVGLRNYLNLFADARFWNATWNTLEFAAISIPLIVGFGLIFAVMLHNSRFKGKAFVEASLFFPYLLNVSIISLIWAWLVDPDYGIMLHVLRLLGWESVPAFLNHPLWVIPLIAVATGWWLSGYRTVVFRAALKDIPQSILESAEIDGANGWTRLTRIMIPLIKPAILFSVVLSALSAFSVLGQVLVMTEGGPGRSSEVLALYLYRLGFHYFRMGEAAAVGFLLFLLMLIVTIVAFRFLGLESEFERRGGGNR